MMIVLISDQPENVYLGQVCVSPEVGDPAGMKAQSSDMGSVPSFSWNGDELEDMPKFGPEIYHLIRRLRHHYYAHSA